jgi:predicted ArsR family transcriptional regulator
VSTRWDERFFSSTRGQVASLLRLGNRTVDELAGELNLTDNAVRAHLAALERDGLVAQGEPRRTGGKPSFTYQLTPEAERLFPKAYGLLLNQLLSVLSERMPLNELDGALREVGHRVAADQPAATGQLKPKIDGVLQVLSTLGGAAVAEETSDGFVIQGCNCPISAAVEGSPNACLIAETMLADLTGLTVRQTCDPGPPPRCRFEISGD